jgi:hypothetical protein
MAISQTKVYASHNTFVVTGRVVDATVRCGKDGSPFLSVTMYHTPVDGDETGVQVNFTTSGSLLNFVEKGYALDKRMLTVTGHIGEVKSYYVDDAGDIQLLQRPHIKLLNAVVMQGGLGPAPAGKSAAKQPRKGAVIKPAAQVIKVEKTQAPVDDIDEVADTVPASTVAV